MSPIYLTIELDAPYLCLCHKKKGVTLRFFGILLQNSGLD